MFDIPVNAKELSDKASTTTTASVSPSESDLPKPSGLGFDVSAFIFYLVCFLIALWILNKFLFSKVAAAITARELRLSEAEKRAEELEMKIANSEKEQALIISEAQEKAREIKQQAIDSMGEEKQKIIDAANYMGEQILKDHTAKAEDIIKLAHQNAETESLKVVETIYKKSVGNLNIDSATQHQVLTQIINSL
jgi:F-type H+-transporting ATPase subunit b